MRQVNGWMTAHDFSLAVEKTEIVILTKKKMPTRRLISIGELAIESKPAVKYLGLMLDQKMSFLEQIKAAADRAAAGVSALSPLMANVGDSISTSRCLLMGATQSILLYGAEVFADTLDKELYRQHLAQVQRRGALRVASAYHTVSELAMMVIGGGIAVVLLAKERKAYENQKRWLPGMNVIAPLPSGNSLSKMSEWTAQLIDNLNL